MNKNILWGALAIVAVVVIVWMISLNSGNNPSLNETATTTSETTGTNTAKTNTTTSKPLVTVKTETFTNILPKVGNYQCDYEVVSATERTTNTVYLSDGKMRAEFRTTTATGGTSNIVLYDGVYLYKWTEGKSVGTATQPKTLSDFPTVIPKDLLAPTSLGSGLNSASWNCHPWTVNKIMLTKPAYLKV